MKTEIQYMRIFKNFIVIHDKPDTRQTFNYTNSDSKIFYGINSKAARNGFSSEEKIRFDLVRFFFH